MNDSSGVEQNATPAMSANGKMYLYDAPEYLNRKVHHQLGWTMPSEPYGFARGVVSIPLVLSEIASAQKHYPIVFSGIDKGQPMAIFSLGKGTNLYIDKEGNWERDCYIPAYLRRYPFATVEGENDQVAVVVDRASNGIVEDSEFPFFINETVSDSLQSMIDLSVKYESDRKLTEVFMDTLRSLDLLTEQHLAQPINGERVPVANFVSIDTERVENLAASDLERLNKNGFLPLIFAQLFSQEHWGKIMARTASLGTE